MTQVMTPVTYTCDPGHTPSQEKKPDINDVVNAMLEWIATTNTLCSACFPIPAKPNSLQATNSLPIREIYSSKASERQINLALRVF